VSELFVNVIHILCQELSVIVKKSLEIATSRMGRKGNGCVGLHQIGLDQESAPRVAISPRLGLYAEIPVLAQEQI
jgi:hypothetical protein